MILSNRSYVFRLYNELFYVKNRNGLLEGWLVVVLVILTRNNTLFRKVKADIDFSTGSVQGCC